MSNTKYIFSESAEQTEILAESIGRALRGGEVIELVSDLGGGKTTFTRGLARGAGSSDHVSSPTFTISQMYEAPHFSLYHFDFYRLHEPGLIEHELAESVDQPYAVTVVEWAEKLQHVLPDNRLTIHIKHAANGGRELTLRYPDSLQYLVEGVV